jgi:hypothetical protein
MAMGEKRNAFKPLSRKVERRGHLRDIDVGRRKAVF